MAEEEHHLEEVEEVVHPQVVVEVEGDLLLVVEGEVVDIHQEVVEEVVDLHQ